MNSSPTSSISKFFNFWIPEENKNKSCYKPQLCNSGHHVVWKKVTEFLRYFLHEWCHVYLQLSRFFRVCLRVTVGKPPVQDGWVVIMHAPRRSRSTLGRKMTTYTYCMTAIYYHLFFCALERATLLFCTLSKRIKNGKHGFWRIFW